MNRLRLLGVGLGLLALVSSCASSTERGRVLFGEKRFIEAAEVFEHSEAQLDQYESQERARYGLYRGMTLLGLGDLDGAARWLYFAQSSEAAHPGSLGPAELTALHQADKLLNEARSREPRSPDPLRDAVARSKSAGADFVEPDSKSKEATPPSTPVLPTTPSH